MLVSMRRQLDLAGKSLAGMGLTGIVGYVIATAPQHVWPVWPYWLFGGMVVAGGVAYVIGQRQPASQTTEAIEAPEESGDAVPAPIFTGSWRHTLNGGEVPGLLMVRHKGFSHPGYMRPASDKRPPSVRFGVIVACEPLGQSPTTSGLRDCFLNFLASQPVSDLVSALTYVGDGLTWMSYASSGRFHNEAVLVSGADQADAPVVSAMMNLHEPGLAHYGHDQRTAELVLHVEPRDKDGSVAPPAGLQAWRDTLLQALDMPRAFAHFLNQDLGLTAYGEPAAQFGMELSAQHSITELIDAGGLPTVAGSWQSNSFLSYVVAEHDGAEPADAALEMLRGICDHALHLHDYEGELDKLRNA